MKATLNRIAAMLGYFPSPGKSASSTIPLELKFQIDTAPLDAAIAKLDQVADAARGAETAINEALLAQEGEFISAELVTDDTQALILDELRKLTTLAEVLAKQGDRAAPTGTTIDHDSYQLKCETRALIEEVRRHLRDCHASGAPTPPATGAAASGLPG